MAPCVLCLLADSRSQPATGWLLTGRSASAKSAPSLSLPTALRPYRPSTVSAPPLASPALHSIHHTPKAKKKSSTLPPFHPVFSPLLRLLRLREGVQEWAVPRGAGQALAPGLLQVQSLQQGAQRRVHQQVSMAWSGIKVIKVLTSVRERKEALRAASCGLTLVFSLRDGIPYCEMDYHAMFGIQCENCKKYITGKVLEVKQLQ